jgi:hypothetical protein
MSELPHRTPLAGFLSPFPRNSCGSSTAAMAVSAQPWSASMPFSLPVDHGCALFLGRRT